MKKDRFTLEYPFNSASPQILWVYVSTANGLSEWFADKVTSDSDRNFIFEWNKHPMGARMTSFRHESFARYKWADDETDGDDEAASKYYFEFRILQSELTGETVLAITDFAYPDEAVESRDLWNSQIGVLKRLLGV